MFVKQMTPHIMGPSVRMLGMVPVLVTDGDIASDTCASQVTAVLRTLTSVFILTFPSLS
jgi:hypothetical protein